MESETPVPLVTLVFVTHNSAGVLDACLAACAAPDLPRVIVDNASTDATLEIAGRVDPAITLIRLPENAGYGRAANRGLAQVRTPFALLLNPDILIAPERIRALVAAHQAHAPLALSTCLLEIPQPDGTLRLDTFTATDPDAEVTFVSRIIGAAMLFDMARLDRVGRFDEAIFLYYEDDALCLRLRQAGERIAIFPRIRATHLYGRSAPQTLAYGKLKTWHMTWAKLYFRSLEHGRPYALRLALSSMPRFALHWAGARLAGRRETAALNACRLGAAIAFVRGRPAAYRLESPS